MGGRQNVQATSMPSTILLLTARSTVLRASFADSTGVFWRLMLVEKAARGADWANVRGIWRVATRRAAVCVKDDMMICVAVDWW